jgi:acyl-CoA reductase-like NAD-dependent aldehyde dehydrogenase
MSTALQVETYPCYIGGEWIETSRQFDVRLPYDGTLVARVHQGDAATLDQAVAAAREGHRAMAAMANCERADLLQRAAAILERDAEEFARILCLETGKPIREARVEAERARQTVLAAAHEARQLHGEVVPMDYVPMGKGRLAMTFREPVGVIGAITPFNVPLNLALHKVAPALAAGNAVVHKPAEKTPWSAVRLARVFAEAGAPKGAYNVVNGMGPELGPLMARHPGLAMLTFTGSAAVGRQLRASAGLKRVTLELGNNSAVMVEPDADLDNAALRSVQGGFAHSGQVCISVQRIYAHESILSALVHRMREHAERLKIGHPLEESTDISSLITVEAAERVEAWIEEAIAQGARRVTGGPRRHATIPPTILTDVRPDARVSCEEAFGPLVVVHPYASLDQAVAAVNDSPYGLQAGVYTRDLEKAFRAARALRVGGVLINDVPMFRADHMPYGGVKESGVGREGPRYAIEEMTDVKIVIWKA